MHTMSFQAPEELYKRLQACAEGLDRSKGYLIRAALEEYLEDIEDLAEAKKYKETYNPAENVPFEDIKRKYDLD